MKATGYGVFTGGDFFEGAAKMDGDGSTAGGRPPRHGLGKSIVDLEGAGRVFKGLNCLPIDRREPITGHGEQGAWSGVAQGQSVPGGHIAKELRIDASRSMDKAPEGLEMANECARNGRGASPRNGPSNRVCGRAQQHGSARTEGTIEGEYGVSGESGEESPCANDGKANCQCIGWLHGCKTKTSHKERMTGNAEDRAERTFGKLIPTVGEWFNEAPPGSAICAEFFLCRGQVAFQHHGCAVVEGMGNGRFPMHPFEPVLGQWKGVEKR
jgi:hypothetical protein